MRLPDRMTLAFTVAGAMLVAYTVAALLVIAIPELSSLSHLLSVAAEPDVISSIFLTFHLIALGLLIFSGRLF